MVERAHSSSFFIAFLIFDLIILFLDMQRLAVHLLHICTVVAHNCNTTVYSLSLCQSHEHSFASTNTFWMRHSLAISSVKYASILAIKVPCRRPLSVLLLSFAVHVCRRCRIFYPRALILLICVTACLLVPFTTGLSALGTDHNFACRHAIEMRCVP
jgi:hypothetical protein